MDTTPAATPAATPSTPTAAVGLMDLILSDRYRHYWITWVGLLILTLVMVAISSPTLLLIGITIKASVIMWIYMHLKQEHVALVISVVFGIFVTSMILFLLLIPDGMAM